MQTDETPNWFALYTRARAEKQVNRELQQKGIESYLPLQTVIRRWSDRRKKVALPLFSCYVFMRIPYRRRMLAVQTAGVVRLVSFDGVPAVIPDAEIETVRRVLEGSSDFEPIPYLQVGEEVEVTSGPFAGIQGRLLQQRGRNRLVVGIRHIRQAVSIEIHPADVRPLHAPAPA